MRVLLVLGFVAFVTCAENFTDEDIREEWTQYKAKHGKNYDADEDEKRFEIYLRSKEDVRKNNKLYSEGKITYMTGINKFSDWFPEEIKNLFGLLKPTNHSLKSGKPFVQSIPDEKLPKRVNWVKRGAVTPPKDQFKCGACWAFSAVGALESQMILKHNKRVSLSEQNLISCSTAYGNKGCEGGNMVPSYRYIMDNGGIDSERSYPYLARNSKCQFSNRSIAATVENYVVIPHSEKAMKAAVATAGPIAAGFLIPKDLLSYVKGVVDGVCTNHGHAILMVGYDEYPRDEQIPYWLVKNSWGRNWGLNGYFKMALGKNLCQITASPSYPIPG